MSRNGLLLGAVLLSYMHIVHTQREKKEDNITQIIIDKRENILQCSSHTHERNKLRMFVVFQHFLSFTLSLSLSLSNLNKKNSTHMQQKLRVSNIPHKTYHYQASSDIHKNTTLCTAHSHKSHKIFCLSQVSTL